MPPPPRPPRKTRGPTAASADQIRSRRRGALLGLSVGAAMGVRTRQRQLSADPFPKLMDGPLTEPRGGGPFEARPGQINAATEMATLLSITLRNERRYDQLQTGRAYARWLPGVEPQERVADAVRAAMGFINDDGRSPEFTGRRVWLEGFQKVRDNNALARTTPIGVFFHDRREERVVASFEDTSITHYDPICQLASAQFNGIIAGAIAAPGEKLDPDQLMKIAEAELSYSAALLGRREADWVTQTKESADQLRDDLRMAQEDDPELYGPDLHLFFPWPTLLRVTYRLAFWELFHAPSLADAVIDVINRGGDAEVNGAVVGALFGAIFGEEAIPQEWAELVLEARGNQATHPRVLITME